MNLKFLLSCIGLFCLFCCQSKQFSDRFATNAIIVPDKPAKNYRLKMDSVRIPSPFPDGPNGNYTSCYFVKDTPFLVLEDCVNLRLIAYNFSNFSSFVIPDKYLKCGPSHNLFILDKDHFFKLNDMGDLTKYGPGKVEMVENFTQNSQMRHLGLWANSSLNYFNEIRQIQDSLIFFPVDVNPGLKQKKYSESDFGYPITAAFNLKSKAITFEGITWPEYLYSHNFGLYNEIEQYYDADFIYYAFAPLPEIWRYNRKNKEVERILVKSAFDSIPTAEITFKRTPKTKDLVYQHGKINPHYERLVHDPVRRLFYRFYALPMPEKNPDGLYSTYKDRRYSLMVLDESFRPLAETLLPKECFFIYFAVPTKDGLYINFGPLGDKTQENGIKTLRIQLVDSH